MPSYPGGKAGAGVYQRIINEMPPHERYIEPFCGAGAILLRKRPALENVILDKDAAVLEATVAAAERLSIPAEGRHLTWLHGCGIDYLERTRLIDRDTLIYCDPPYVMSARSGRRIYDHELADADHARLLEVLERLPAMVMLSGYDNLLYRAGLSGWRRIEYMAATRGGPREEVLWCNFPPPRALHDYQYLGEDFRQRQDIRRKVARWQNRFAGLPVLERRAILSALLRIETRDRPSATPPIGDSTIGEPAYGDVTSSASTIGTPAGDELGERPRHNGGFPQSGQSASPRAPLGETAEPAE